MARSFMRNSGCVRRQETVSGETASSRFSSGLSEGRMVSKGSTSMRSGGLELDSLPPAAPSALMTISVGSEPGAEGCWAGGVWAAAATARRSERLFIVFTPARI
jgi:hypothetical protein